MMLSLDIEGNVKPRLEGLAQLLPGHDITAMIGKVPRLLGCDLTKVEQKVRSIRVRWGGKDGQPFDTRG